MKQVNQLKHEIASKKSEIDNLYTDMDGVYQAHDKSDKIQRELDAKLKVLEEKFLQVSKSELKFKQELNYNTILLDEAVRSLNL
jgi:actin-related protein